MVGITEISKPVAKKTGLSQKKAREVINAFLEEVLEQVNKGESVRIAGLGIFERRVQKARKVRNPRTGKMMKVGEKKKLVFKPSANIKYL
ncbi:MAG: HU family DNA-binding protein [Euryarchaeota archaeon]|uniref:Nucleoid DNA binding protein n=1 Tax=uncultured euryarchaeote Alv-FOS4 TaxID=337893 RepID=Q3SA65_9EURY|nr:nucleoid DNA binding protein [uncultured euryarchaeote Alv-FOS4]NPA75965.1 HU family DNA-binding protein [Euryarchaeota archaeon]